MGAKQHYANLNKVPNGRRPDPRYLELVERARKLAPGGYFTWAETRGSADAREAEAKRQQRAADAALTRYMDSAERKGFKVIRTEEHEVVIVRQDPKHPIVRGVVQ